MNIKHYSLCLQFTLCSFDDLRASVAHVHKQCKQIFYSSSGQPAAAAEKYTKYKQNNKLPKYNHHNNHKLNRELNFWNLCHTLSHVKIFRRKSTMEILTPPTPRLCILLCLMCTNKRFGHVSSLRRRIFIYNKYAYFGRGSSSS